MNNRIKDLIEQCTYVETVYENGIDESVEKFDKEMFAGLIVKSCMAIVSLYRRDNLLDKAIADTLEHCYQEMKNTWGVKL